MAIDKVKSTLEYALGVAATEAGIKPLALRLDEASGKYTPGSARETPTMAYRNPVAVWLDGTQLAGGADERAKDLLPTWCLSATVRGESNEQCLEMLRRLAVGVEIELDGEMIALTPFDMLNSFAPASRHPTHMRTAQIQLLLTRYQKLQLLGEKSASSCPVMVFVEHTQMANVYKESGCAGHYGFFWDRIFPTPQREFDARFETLLRFLVEAIGVPVLLSLLLLTYASTSSNNPLVINLEDLPDCRLQLYKLGIQKGIRKRLKLEASLRKTVASAESGTAAGGAAGAAEALDESFAQSKGKVKRKAALQNEDSRSFTAVAGGDEQSFAKKSSGGGAHASKSAEPVLDLNSLLRGKKVRTLTGEDDVAEAYSLVVRVLDKSKQPGFDLRSGIVSVVPKSHSMHLIVTALVEYVLMPPQRSDESLQETATTMLRRVAVDNQENGRREFTSKHMVCCLGATPLELGLWSTLDLNYDHGVALVATLAKQGDKAPAQYQFKHLSFQEGLYAEHLLMLVTSLTPPVGPGWPCWATDQSAAEFLNNRYMNNTCRIAAGTLGGLLARQRPHWNFRDAPLTYSGRAALTFVTEECPHLESINLSQK